MKPAPSDETRILARGGRTSFTGFLLRLGARFPFLFIASHLYGAESLGRFAYAILSVELMAQLATLGLKRGLAAEMADPSQPQNHDLADALLVGWAGAALGAILLIALPVLVFPNGGGEGIARLFPLIALAITGSDIALAALAFRGNIGAQVTARSLVEPWMLAGGALLLGLAKVEEGLLIAYTASLIGAFLFSIVPAWREFGLPRGWTPNVSRLFILIRANLPLAGADAADWSARRLDVVILGRFASAEVVGIYFVAQSIASLAGKLKTSFDAILAPVVTTNLARGDLLGVAAHLRQVSFWVASGQIAVAMGLGFTAVEAMRLFGTGFESGAPVLVLLLVAEVFGAQGAIAEAALVYLRRVGNLAVSLAGLALEAALAIILSERYGGPGAAAALAAAFLVAAIIKCGWLSRLLGARVDGWRLSLPLAAIVALPAGLLAMQFNGFLPGLAGLFMVIGVFGAAIWLIGYRGSDRLLFAARKG